MRPKKADLHPARITAGSRSSFLVSFSALEPERRRSLTAIYAFCRVVDDAVDESSSPEEGRAALAFWSKELDAAFGGTPTTHVGQALADAARQHGVQHRHLALVVEGMALDLEAPQLKTATQFDDYCYKVASAVGLACLPAFGVPLEHGAAYAEAMGRALQTTNVLRDLVEDARLGRIYVPQEWLDAEGVEPAWLSGTGPDLAYRPEGPMHRLVQRLASVAEHHYQAAARARPAQYLSRLVAPEIMGAVYHALLQVIVGRRGEIRGKKARLSRLRKVWIVWRTRRRCR